MPAKRTGCRYLITRDAVARTAEGVEITVQPGGEALPAERTPTLEVGMIFRYKKNRSIKVDPSLIQLQAGSDNKTLSPQVVHDYDSPLYPNWDYQFKRLALLYPEPAGFGDHIIFLFRPSAVIIDGQQLPDMQFRFNRVEKSDIYMASINC
jgi:hypothetical protein